MKSLIALVGSLVVAGTTSADLMDLHFAPIDNGPDYVTYRLYASFDNPNDRIGAFAGLDGLPLLFYTDVESGIYNDDGYYGGGHTDDIPFGDGANVAFDTWLTIGQIGGFDGFPSFTPDFLGVPGGENLKVLVDGMTEIEDDNSAVYFSGPAKPVNTWGDNNVPIDVALAQFSVESPGGGYYHMYFAAVIQWFPEGGNAVQTYTDALVVWPAPGSLAILGLAGLRTRRRR